MFVFSFKMYVVYYFMNVVDHFTTMVVKIFLLELHLSASVLNCLWRNLIQSGYNLATFFTVLKPLFVYLHMYSFTVMM